MTSNGPEFMTHRAAVEWGDNVEDMLDEKKAKIEQAIKALIDELDHTNVTSITFSKIETDGNEKNQDEEVGSATAAA